MLITPLPIHRFFKRHLKSSNHTKKSDIKKPFFKHCSIGRFFRLDFWLYSFCSSIVSWIHWTFRKTFPEQILKNFHFSLLLRIRKEDAVIQAVFNWLKINATLELLSPDISGKSSPGENFRRTNQFLKSTKNLNQSSVMSIVETFHRIIEVSCKYWFQNNPFLSAGWNLLCCFSKSHKIT